MDMMRLFVIFSIFVLGIISIGAQISYADVTVITIRPLVDDVTEGLDHVAYFEVGLTNFVATETIIEYTYSGTARNGVDYAFLPNTIVIPPGAYSTLFPILILNDNDVEPPEGVTIRLTSILRGDPDIQLGFPVEASILIRDFDTEPISCAAGTTLNIDTNECEADVNQNDLDALQAIIDGLNSLITNLNIQIQNLLDNQVTCGAGTVLNPDTNECVIDTDTEKVTLCHKDKKTITISSEDVGDHLSHGDEIGACEE